MKVFFVSVFVIMLFWTSGCQQGEGDEARGEYDNLEIIENESGGGEDFPFSLFTEEGGDSNERMEEKETQNDEEPVRQAAGVKKEIVSLTNEEREKNGLDPVQMDETVAEAAQAKSEDMAANNYFDHQSPTYGSPFEMLQEFGVDFKVAAENIAAGQESPQEAVEGWMNSEGHRKNILNEDLTHIGIGYEEEGRYWTQMFIGK